MLRAYKGDIVYSEDKDNLKVFDDSYIIVKEGKVLGIFEELPEEYRSIELIDHSDKMIIPAFSDMHLHASQYYQRE